MRLGTGALYPRVVLSSPNRRAARGPPGIPLRLGPRRTVRPAIKEDPLRVRALARSALAVVGATLAALVVVPPSGFAASIREAGPVRPAPLDGVRARGPVRDVVLPGPRARAAAPTGRAERFRDAAGRPVIVTGDAPAASLRAVAEILVATLHGDEIERLRVRVVSLAEMPVVCHPDAVACYALEGGTAIGRARGEMVVAHDDPDLVHTVVHEYGHHLDAQLWNFAASGPCAGLDGSRRWLFARGLEAGERAPASCGPGVPWQRLLPEVFAEDVVALNGIVAWELPDLPSPGPVVLHALRADVAAPFRPARRTVRGRVAAGGRHGTLVRADAPTFLTVSVAGPARSGLDLVLRPAGGGPVVAASAHPGSRERVEVVVPAGAVRVVVHATGRAGPYRLSVLSE